MYEYQVYLCSPLSTQRLGTIRTKSLRRALNLIALRWRRYHPDGYVPAVEQVGSSAIVGKVYFEAHHITVEHAASLCAEATQIANALKPKPS